MTLAARVGEHMGYSDQEFAVVRPAVTAAVTAELSRLRKVRPLRRVSSRRSFFSRGRPCKTSPVI